MKRKTAPPVQLRKRSKNRDWLFLLFGASVALCGFSLVLGSNTSYPEMGEEVDPEKKEDFKDAINCAIDSMPEDLKMMLGDCSADDVSLHDLNEGEITHWKHGSEDKMEAPAFTPESTPEQMMGCQLCIAVGDALCGGSDQWKKEVMAHEVIHWTQIDFWTEVYCPSEELFNEPWDGEESPEGKNGNPPAEGEPTTPEQMADQKTRELFDKFEELRSEMTESEAILEDVDHGCTTGRLGPWWLKPPAKQKQPAGDDSGDGDGRDGDDDGDGEEEEEEEEECKPRLKEMSDKIGMCMEDLEMMAEEATDGDGEEGNEYDKYKAFAEKLNKTMDQKKMDAMNRQNEICAAIDKFCKNQDGGGDGGDDGGGDGGGGGGGR